MKQISFIKFILLSFLVLKFVACIDAPVYSDIPNISNISLSGNNFNELDVDAELLITIDFEDGNGDIGMNVSNGDTTFSHILKIDSRVPDIVDTLTVNTVIGSNGAVDDISGSIYLSFFSTEFVCTENTPQQDYFYTFSITDRAGNVSNEFVAPLITINCN